MVSLLRSMEPDYVESVEFDVNSRVSDFVRNCLSGFDGFKEQIPLPGGVAALTCKFELKPESVLVENGIVYMKNWRGRLTDLTFSDRCDVDSELQRAYDHLFQNGYQVSISSFGRDNMAFDMQISLDQFEAVAKGI